MLIGWPQSPGAPYATGGPPRKTANRIEAAIPTELVILNVGSPLFWMPDQGNLPLFHPKADGEG